MEEGFCKNCGKCCEFISADLTNKILFRDGIETLSPEFEAMLEPYESRDGISICKCKYLKDKICTNNNKPQECEKFPSSPFAFLPDDCFFEGKIFSLNENIKQKIRKLKEEIIHYETLIDTTFDKKEKEQYQKIINSHNSHIQKYKNYGSLDW